MDNSNQPIQAARIIKNPSKEQLRALAEPEEKKTCYGSISFVSKVRNRSAKNTFIVDNGYLGVDQQAITLIDANKTVQKVHAYLKDREIISVDRQLGRNANFNINCRLIITKEYARLPLMWYNLLFEPAAGEFKPELTSIYVPEWPERVILVYPEAGVTYILGTDYFGEAKKSFLRMALYKWKRKGGIGFHAGSKVLRVLSKKGSLEDVGFIIFGLKKELLSDRTTW